MSVTINFSAALVPVPFERPYQRDKVRFNSKRYSDFKLALGLVAKAAMRGRAPFSGEISLHADFFKPKPKPRKNKPPLVSFIGDGDNFLKAVMDALQGVCYFDDRQVTQGSFSKIFGEPHIFIQLEALS